MLDDDTWQDAFKRGILLADAKITPVERRANVTRLDTLAAIFRCRCARCISSGATGRHYSFSWLKSARYSKLQQSTDAN
jgi:aspartate carbamoyltransferase regulatory subunit